MIPQIISSYPEKNFTLFADLLPNGKAENLLNSEHSFDKVK